MVSKTVIGNAQHLQDVFNKLPEGTSSFTAWWSSPEKFAAEVESWDKNKAWHKSAWDSDDASFYGTKDMPEAIALARYGWKEGVHQIKRIRTAIHAAHPLTKQPVKYGIAGSIPNVPRAIAGNLLNMRTTDLHKSRKRPVITLLSDMGANCGHHSSEFLNRAAVVAALIDQIENQGFSCEVLGYATSKGYGGGEFQSVVTVMLKNSNQPVDIARLAFGLGHPAMFRRLIFAQWGIDRANEPLDDGLGCTLRLSEEGLADKAIYVIPSVSGNASKFKTEEAAVKEGLPYLVGKLKEQGCPAV